MRKLNKCEEMQIIKEVMSNQTYNSHCGLIDYGSSRAVFEYGDDKVVKVAYDDGGRIQNKHEIEMYKAHPEICAELFAYGSSIIVMERVEVCDECCELIEDYYDCSDDGTFDTHEDEENFLARWDINECDIQAIIEVANTADDILGQTADNAQIGYSANQEKYCLYDYGFDLEYADIAEEEDLPDQVGSMSSHLDSFENEHAFLADLVYRIRHGKLFRSFKNCWF